MRPEWMQGHKDECTVVSETEKVAVINCKCGLRPPMMGSPPMFKRNMFALQIRAEAIVAKQKENLENKGEYK